MEILTKLWGIPPQHHSDCISLLSFCVVLHRPSNARPDSMDSFSEKAYHMDSFSGEGASRPYHMLMANKSKRQKIWIA